MKKMTLATTALMLATLTLVGCGNNNANGDSSLKAENSSLKQEVKSLKAQIKTQSESATENKENSEESENPNKTTKSTAVMGQEYVIKSKDGKKLVGLTLTQADNKFSGYAAEDEVIEDSDFNMDKKDNMIQLSMKFTNYGLDDEWEPITAIEVYDSTGAQAEENNYADGGDMVSVGHSGTFTTWYALSQRYTDNKKLEVEYSEYLTAAGADDSEKYSAKWVIEQ